MSVENFALRAVGDLVDEARRLRTELEASQAREKILRDAHGAVVLRANELDVLPVAMISHTALRQSISTDDTALRQAIRAAKEEMRERCAQVCERSVYYIVQSSAASIRALEVE